MPVDVLSVNIAKQYVDSKEFDGSAELIKVKLANLETQVNDIQNNDISDLTHMATVEYFNLFDGKFSYFGLNSNEPHCVQTDSTHAKRSAVIDVKPNTTYSIIRQVTDSSFGKIASFDVKKNSIVNGTVPTQFVDIGGLLSYQITTGLNDKSICIYTSYTSKSPLVQIVEGTQNTFTVDSYDDSKLYHPNKLNVYDKSETYSKSQVEEKLKLKSCFYKKTGDVLDIYMPSKNSDRFIHFSYQKVVDKT